MDFVRIRPVVIAAMVIAAGVCWNTAAWATVSTWQAMGPGPFSWLNGPNWDTNPTVPNAVSDTASFTTAGGATQTVNLNNAITLGTLNVTNPSTSFTIANGTGGSFTFDNSGEQAKITSGVGSVNQTIDASITAGGVGLTVEQFGENTLTLNGPIDAGFAPLVVNSGVATGTPGNVVINGVISGSAGFIKHNTNAVAGNVTLTAANTYSGDTFFGTDNFGSAVTVAAGKLTLSGGDNRLPAGSVLHLSPKFYQTLDSYSGAVDFGSTDQTLSTIKMPTDPFGGTPLVGVGSVFTITGTGTLTLNGDDFLVGIAGGGATYTGNNTQTVDLSGLSHFVFNNPDKSIGVHSAGGRISATRIAGTIRLANTSNTINAKSLLVADFGGANIHGGARSDFFLGANANVLNIGSNATDGIINVGYSGRSRGDLNLPADATVTIRGFGGGSAPLPLFLLSSGSNNDNTFTSTVNFTNGTSNAIVTRMEIATANNIGGRGGTTVGNFNLGATSGPEGFTIGTLDLGRITETASPLNPNSPIAGLGANFAAIANFTVNSPNAVLNVSTINFSTNTILDSSSFTKTVTGNLNLVDGTIRATTMQLGSQIGTDNVSGLPSPGTATTVRNVNWSAGTIENLPGTNLAISDVPVTLLTNGPHIFNATGSNTITLAASAPISGDTFGVTKTGTGGLVLNGANTHTGVTTVEGGSLTVTGAAATVSGGDLTVNAGSAVISAGVTNAIADTALLTLLGGGTANVADTGFLNLGAGINETVNMLILGAAGQASGTYGSSSSGAMFKLDDYFAGTGMLTVLNGPAALLGDFNGDGKVDAADYVVWRKSPGSFPGDAYATWRANFGNPPGSGAGLESGAVPEPSAILLLLVGFGFTIGSGRRFSRLQRG